MIENSTDRETKQYLVATDNKFKNKLRLKQTLVREGSKVTPNEAEHNESSRESRVSGNNQSEEMTSLVDEEEFSAIYMAENRGAECINVIASLHHLEITRERKKRILNKPQNC